MVQAVNEMTNPSETKFARLAVIRDTLLREVEDLAPLISKHADFADKEARVANEVIEGLMDAQLFRLWLPQRYNGLQVDIMTQVLVTSEIAKYCSSAAWVTALYGACQWFTSLYSERAQEEVFGNDNDARVCGVLAPTATIKLVRGGIRVTGRWAYASGSAHATWATVGTPRKNGGEGTDLVLIPMTELTIDRTWDTAGMRGTASDTLCAEDVFVPDHRILSFFCADGALEGHTDTEFRNEVLFRTPLAGFATVCVIGPLIGMARVALEHTLNHINGRAVAYTISQDQSALVSTQLAIAEAAMKIDSAELHIHRAATDLDEAAELPDLPDLIWRARTRHHLGWGTQLLREAMLVLQQVNGSSDMQRGGTFERIWRDFSTSSAHAVLSVATTGEVYGKVLCGHEPNVISTAY
ncbi:MAG: acyl-CoA dehydrogenase family protein [Pseudomonadota bacterium]|nr:acyl-CoA dehydrogenase family protein [Pseudomonadota bacterium]